MEEKDRSLEQAMMDKMFKVIHRIDIKLDEMSRDLDETSKCITEMSRSLGWASRYMAETRNDTEPIDRIFELEKFRRLYEYWQER
ncbi:MAG: hypothetical protein Q8R53_04525, partial [Nanoarchaeota archaeon]|nr:hypothetical protein [Nanoarchaeota archaeon]